MSKFTLFRTFDGQTPFPGFSLTPLQKCHVLTVLDSVGYLFIWSTNLYTSTATQKGNFPFFYPNGTFCAVGSCTVLRKSFQLSKYSVSGLPLFSPGWAPFMALSSKSVIQGTFLRSWSVLQTERPGPDSPAPAAARGSAPGAAPSSQTTGQSVQQAVSWCYIRTKTTLLSHTKSKAPGGRVCMGTVH